MFKQSAFRILLLILITSLLQSCGDVAKMEAKKPNYAVMDVFYATDRKAKDTTVPKERYGAERGPLEYGQLKISIPREHRMGEIESPSILKLEFKEDPEKHISLLEIAVLDSEAYFTLLSDKVRSSTQKNAFIFVHGYNVTFENAAKRTAQIAYGLGFDGAPVFYSWPSHGNTAKYTFDEANIKWAQTDIEHFLKEFTEKSDADNIYLIAHSMGNRALTRAYASLMNKHPKLASRFQEVILAAPDIDADVFKREIAPAMIQAGNPITLYASSHDIPLKASKTVHGGHPRAGDSGEDIIVMDGIESIDASKVKTSFLGHSYFADEQSILSDMFYIINNNLRADQRSGLANVKHDQGQYWQFKQ